MSAGAEETPAVAAPDPKVERAKVWKLLGAPTDQVGSVNDPRTHEDGGRKWNEKWIYRAEGGEQVERVVLWFRYDFVGAFRVKPDGSLEPEPLPAD